MEVFNKKTGHYNKFKTAVKNGILDNPNNFEIPKDYIIRKDTGKLIKISNARKLIANKKLALKNIITNSKIFFNNQTKRFINITNNNDKKLKKINNEKKKFKNDLDKKFKTNQYFSVSFGKNPISDDELLEYISYRREKYRIKIGDQYYTLTDKSRRSLRELIKNDLIYYEEIDTFGNIISEVRQEGHIDFMPVIKKHQRGFLDGGFFKYINLTDIDLTRYQIYKTIEKENYDETCLLYALKLGGLDDENIEKLKQKVNNRMIPKNKLNEICDIIKCKIILKTHDIKNRGEVKNTFGKKEYERTFNIGILDEHYFLIEKTNITSYALNNYHELKDLKDFNYIINDQRKKNKDRVIDSYDLIKILLENKGLLIDELTYDHVKEIGDTQFYDKISNEIKDLNYDVDECVRPIEKKEKKDNKIEFENVFFDFETYTESRPDLDNDGNQKKDVNGELIFKRVHVPYICRTYNGTESKEFLGEKCGLYMLCSLTKHTRLIAHNASYDFRFLIEYLYNINEISRGVRLISASGRFKKLKIEIKDSLHLITMPLRDFKDVFKLNIGKEIMPYDLYNNKKLREQKFVDVDYVLKNYIKEEDKEEFINNIIKWNLKELDGTYDIIAYSSLYCEIDCKVLHDGYNQFKNWMLESVKINIDDKLTIASLSHEYLVNEGCYDGVYELSGKPQIFIQGCVVGGRTMLSNNKPRYIEEKVNDFDAVSLYPSAMNRIEGFLLGVPKVISNLDYNDLKNKNGYFIEIKINKVGIKRAFSLMSYIDKKGVRQFKNDMEGKIIKVDKTTLEDLIEFQKIEFDIIRGYYFDEGFNPKIKDTIKFLFDERVRYKALKNNIEMVYKLIMNSGYGKSIMKEIETENKFFDSEEKFDAMLSRQYNSIQSYVKFGTKTKVKKIKNINTHYNICQVGVCILSMSKRIMNEVMCLSEDLNLEIYYQDTDSNHIKDKDIKVLSDEFKKKYNRDLIGDKLGQFHSDFEFYDSNGKKRKDIKDIHAVRSIFLGKKCYIDELNGTNKNTGEIEVDYHVRMKGIPNSVINYTCDKMGFKNVFEMYEKLFKGEEINFDLTNDGAKHNFKFNKDYSIETVNLFTRKIKYEIEKK